MSKKYLLYLFFVMSMMFFFYLFNKIENVKAATLDSFKFVSPSDTNIYYSPYNWVKTSTSSLTNSVGAYFKTKFSGSNFKIKITPENDTDILDWVKLSYVIDSTSTNATTTFSTIYTNSSTSIIDFTPISLDYGTHSIQVWIDSIGRTERWIPKDRLNIEGFYIDPGENVLMPFIKPNRILQYGDSITEGWGTLNGGSAYIGSIKTSNQYINSWSFQEANNLNAEIGVRAFSGEGYTTSALIPGVVLPGSGYTVPSWNYLASGTLMNFADDKAPNLIINNHGTNDPVEMASSVVITFINNIRGLSEIASTTPIVLLQPVTTSNTTKPSIAAAFNSQSDRNVYFVNPGPCLTCALHPTMGAQEDLVTSNVMTALNLQIKAGSPYSLATTSVSDSLVSFSWLASTSTKNLPDTGYRIYKNGIFFASSTDLSFTDTGLISNTTYNYSVSAINNFCDTVGSEYESAPTPLLSVNTLPATILSSPYIGTATAANPISMGGIIYFSNTYNTYAYTPAVNNTVTTVATQTISAKSIFIRNLKPGSKGDDVKQLQKFLNANGYKVTVSGQETMYFGAATKAALIKYQEANRSSVLAPLNLTKGSGNFFESTRRFVNQSNN